ncbi:MAG: type IX secretion system membrane protein PorP/SprF [Elusimicrobiota bacterium]
MKKNIILVSLIFAFCGGNAFAKLGDAGWVTLKKVQSPRFRSIAATSLTGRDLSGIFYNPSLISENDNKRLYVSSEFGFVKDTLGGFIYAQPLKNGCISVTGMFYDAGTMDLNWINDNDVETEKVPAQKDSLLMITYARKLKEKLSVGISVKHIDSTIARQVSANANAVDLGLLYTLQDDMNAALSLNNLGKASAYVEKEDPLPAILYCGLNKVFELNSISLMPAVGYSYSLNEGAGVTDIGIEMVYNNFSINCGYKINMEDLKLHTGFGIIHKKINLNYAFVPSSFFESTHRISLGYEF